MHGRCHRHRKLTAVIRFVKSDQVVRAIKHRSAGEATSVYLPKRIKGSQRSARSINKGEVPVQTKDTRTFPSTKKILPNLNILQRAKMEGTSTSTQGVSVVAP